MAITPYLYYEDVDRALAFLAKAFGLRKSGAVMRGTDGKINHAAMKLGDGLVMMGRPPGTYLNPKRLGHKTQSLYVNVTNVDRHFQRARKAGADIIEEPGDSPGRAEAEAQTRVTLTVIPLVTEARDPSQVETPLPCANVGRCRAAPHGSGSIAPPGPA